MKRELLNKMVRFASLTAKIARLQTQALAAAQERADFVARLRLEMEPEQIAELLQIPLIEVGTLALLGRTQSGTEEGRDG